MGWTIDIKSNKPITVEEVDQIVRALPDKFQNCFSRAMTRQSWGWSAGVDVYNPKGEVLTLHGSYGQSGQIAEPAAKEIAEGLRKLGHEIEIGLMEG